MGCAGPWPPKSFVTDFDFRADIFTALLCVFELTVDFFGGILNFSHFVERFHKYLLQIIHELVNARSRIFLARHFFVF